MLVPAASSSLHFIADPERRLSIMKQVSQIFNALVAAGLLPAVLAVPAPQMSYGENTGPVAGVSPPILTATALSGSLYGPQSLRGEIAQPLPVSGGDSTIVSDYPLVNGQEADKDLGLYLDFNSVENPQPIRGNQGQTGSGPSELLPAFLDEIGSLP
jgi:hypothetical protein